MERERLQEWKEALLKEIKELQSKLAPLEIELRVKEEKLAALDRLLQLEIHPDGAVSSLEDRQVRAGSNTKKVADVAYEVLKKAGTPLYYRELYEKISQTGFDIHGKDPATNLIAHIGNDPRFKRVKRGTYALAEWKIKKRVGKPKRRRRSRNV
ncbi:MAG TPA: winged helix-turn-helix domain-containing protein [Dehalococcoidia bacterium]|nr:winged helix-turn-helix domain-containing protein [Dehalococcoidia bacterium]